MYRTINLRLALMSAACMVPLWYIANPNHHPYATQPELKGTSSRVHVKAKHKATLLFKSGFESSVTLGPTYNDGGGTWFQDILGADDTGYAWPMHIWGAPGVLQVLVDSSLPVDDYLENRLETTIGHTGQPTTALHMIQYQKAQEWTQDPYILFTDGIETSDLFISYWMKFPADLASRMGFDGWFAFMEWKTCCNEDRIAAYVYEEVNSNQLYWYVQNDNETDGASNHIIRWEEENRSVPVPVGQWFHVEVFLHRSTGADGRFWWAINGRTIVDHHGQNKHTHPFNRFMPFTLYTNAQQMDLWIDDIQIWDTMPAQH